MAELGTHYKYGYTEEIEVLRVMKDKMTPEQFRGYCLGCMIKYTLRANFKDNFKSDLAKAEHYGRILKEFEDEEIQRNKDRSLLHQISKATTPEPNRCIYDPPV